jgi:hypothetical protein
MDTLMLLPIAMMVAGLLKVLLKEVLEEVSG